MALSEQVRTDLVWLARDFDGLVTGASPAELRAPTLGTRWNNEQLLFHLWFGQRIARAFIPIVGGFARMPAGASAAWARLLTAATAPYDWVNYAAPVAGVRLGGLGAARRWMRSDTEWLLRWAARASAADLARGMSVPESWDPYFSDWMDRADVLAWAPKHYRHHRAQLTLSARSDP